LSEAGGNEQATPVTYTAYVSRKITRSDGNYGSDGTEAGLHMQIQLPADTDPTSDEAQTAVRNLINAAKCRVFDAAGVAWETNDAGEVMEKAGPNASQGDAAAAIAAEFGGAEVVSDVPANPPFSDPEPKSDEERENSKWAAERFAVAPSEFWDNRPVEGRRPHIKHKQFNRKNGWKADLVGWVN